MNNIVFNFMKILHLDYRILKVHHLVYPFLFIIVHSQIKSITILTIITQHLL